MASKVGSVTESTVLTEAYECDYERNCSPLYKAIETAEDEEEYESILEFLETGVWTGPFEGIGGPAPLEQVKTWVTRFDPNDETKVKWSQLPLHLAIVCGAPAQIVASLVKLYPEALRCTDDQHMLPLHLALRNESDDEVVAFLLIQFPEAVNAKGKNGRTAIDCALRAKDKLRGIILEIFTEKTAAKITAQMNKEKKELMNELENRTSELLITAEVLEERVKENEDLATALKEKRAAIPFTEVDSQALAEIEAGFKTKFIEQEKANSEMRAMYEETIEKLQSEKLIQEVVAQKKIDQLLSLVKEKEAEEQKARAEEIAVKRELEAVQGKVAKSSSASEWKEVKKEVETLKAYRLEKTRSETRSTINSLKGELERSVELSKTSDDKLKTELKQEMKMLKSIVDNLQKSESTAKTSSELTALRNEVDVLRVELKERSQTKQTIAEIGALKKALEVELRNADAKTHEELTALKEAIEKANASNLEKTSTKELTLLKEEMETLKLEFKEKELAAKTRKDVDELKATLEREMMNTDSKTSAELNEMKAIVDNLQATLASNRSSEDLVAVKQEVEALKEELKTKETASKIKLEAAMLKKMVENELKQSEGRTQEELLHMKQSIKELTEKANDNKDVEELAKVRSELLLVKDELKEIEKISKTQEELKALKYNLEEQISNTKGKTEEELLSMKRAFDALNSDHLASREFKRTLEEEIKVTTGKTAQELKALKKSIDSIDLRKLETQSQNEWKTIRKEMDVLTAFLKKRQQDGVGETQNELQAVKAAVAAIDLNKLENQNRHEFDSLRTEMDNLKMEMKKKEAEEENLKRELEELKQASQKKKKGLRAFFSRGFVSDKSSSFNNATTNSLQNTANVQNTSTKAAPIEEKIEDVPTIAPPSVTVTQSAEQAKRVSKEGSDDSSWSSPMKDVEKSRLGKMKELSVMQSRSRDYGDLQSVKSKEDLEILSRKSKSFEVSRELPVSQRDNNGMDEREEIEEIDRDVTLPMSKSEVVAKGDNAANYSIKKAKSDNGRFSRFVSSSSAAAAAAGAATPEELLIKSPRSILKIAATGSIQEDSRDAPPATSATSLYVPTAPRMPLTSAMKGSKNSIFLRKVKSMDPRLMSQRSTDENDSSNASGSAYEFVHSRSKPVVGQNGEVELHQVAEDDEDDDDDDRLIYPRVSFVSHFE